MDHKLCPDIPTCHGFFTHTLLVLTSRSCFMPSVLWRSWLGSWKGIRPLRNRVVRCWHCCLERGADLHITQLMLLPKTICCSSKSKFALREWFCFSGAGLPRNVIVVLLNLFTNKHISFTMRGRLYSS